MRKKVVLFFLLCCTQLYSQSKLSTTVAGYTAPQQRLLLKNMGRFLYIVHQGQWDMDSTILYACKLYGLNRMLPYDEVISEGKLAYEVDLLGEGRVEEVIRTIAAAGNEKKIQTWLALAAYYMHMPGALTAHLDSASGFIGEARLLARRLGSAKWLRECDALTGELYFQQGDIGSSAGYFRSVLDKVEKTAPKRAAIAHHQLALHLPFDSIARLRHLEIAFSAFTALKLNEHAIEALSDIITYYFYFDVAKAEAKLKELIVLQRSSGYKHIMDSYYVLAYLRALQSDYFGAIAYADSCMNMMAETGDSCALSMICSRMANMYDGLEDTRKAYEWYQKGLERMDKEPQLFWYRNIYHIKGAMSRLGKSQEFISFLTQTLARYPPQGKIDSLLLVEALAYSYAAVDDIGNAKKHFDNFVAAVDKLPREHIQRYMLTAIHDAGYFYLNIRNYPRARSLLELAGRLARPAQGLYYNESYYGLRYALDSVDGDFKSALIHYQQYRQYRDTISNIAQRFKNRELNVLHATERKDQDIKILKQESALNQSHLKQARQTRNIILAGAGLLVIILFLVYDQYRSKQKNARLIEQKNLELVQLLDEKEWLLKEVHHRVKNSLQTVVSLLELQSEYLQNDALAAIQASQNRIYATSLLHQKLYQFENTASVDMQSYLPELITNLKDAFNTGNEIAFNINVASIELDISQAVPIGLIVNEAITNSIKYAFTGQQVKPQITVSFSASGDEWAELTVSDNGAGFKPFEENERSGLGLKLIRGLGEDIDGCVQIDAANGTRIHISFKRRSPFLSVVRQPNSKSA